VAPQNNYNSNTKDHLSQITITNMTKMKRFVILQELPKYDTEIQSEKMLLGKWWPQTCLMQGCHKLSICQKKKKIAKHNKAKQAKNKVFLYQKLNASLRKRGTSPLLSFHWPRHVMCLLQCWENQQMETSHWVNTGQWEE